ncbi:transcriptional regulator [Actinospongicola halichondriae]|uniref:transcriptional regulator n=1 Tax=Actinospongicola halichondriae TaxID=3236844 RepID=UPI003D3952E7
MADVAAPEDTLDDEERDYSRRVGERLRAIRRQKRQSLHDVEARSEQEFKASVLGAYERGERSISVPRLQRLAGYYDVPVDQLLPAEDNAEIIDLTDRALARQAETQLVLDLQTLGDMGGAEGAMLNRYVRTIQIQRQDFNGRMLTIRRDDVRAIACILGVSTDRTLDRLDQLGLCSVPA